MKRFTLFLLFVLTIGVSASAKKPVSNSPIGEWKQDAAGLPCFEYVGSVPFKATLVTVTIKNKTGNTQHLRYVESIRAQYETIMQQSTPRERRKMKYTPVIADAIGRAARPDTHLSRYRNCMCARPCVDVVLLEQVT